MNNDLYINKTSNVFAENRLLKFGFVILLFMEIVSFFTTKSAMDNQKIILVPPVINSPVKFSGNRVSIEYIKEFTRYAIGLALSYGPHIVRGQFDELLGIYDPEVFPEAQAAYYEIADAVETTKNTSSTFLISSINVNEKEKIIDINGSKKLFQQDKVTENTLKTYIIKYRIKNGRFMIRSLSEREGR